MKLKKLALIGMVVMATMSACGNKGTGNGTDTKTTVEGETTAELKKPSEYGSVELGDYKGIEIPNIDTTASDEIVEAQINNELLQDPDKVEVTDRPIQEGDTVNIDYVGTKDGVAFEGGTDTGYDLVIGSNSFIDGFESGLIGHSIGEDVKLDLTFPEDYGKEDLAGAAVVFDVKINSISVSTPASLTDEWVSRHTNGGQTTVDEYKASIKEFIEEQMKKSAKQQDQYNALHAVIEASTFKLNDEAIDYEYNNIFEPIQSIIEQYSMTLEQYASAYGISEEEMKNQIKEQAENKVKLKLVVNEIFKKEKMSLKDEDYQAMIDISGANVKKEDLIEQYGQEIIDDEVKTYKVINFILDNAKRSDVTLNINGETEGAAEESTAQSEETTVAESEPVSEESETAAQ